MTFPGPEPVDPPPAADAPLPDAPRVLDETTIAELDGQHGPETTDEIVSLFVAELDRRVASLAAMGGIPAATHETHALASAARSVGCLELATLCQDMENAVRAGEVDLAGRVSSILLAGDRARQAISAMQQLRATRSIRLGVQ